MTHNTVGKREAFYSLLRQWHELWRNLASRLPGIRAFIMFAMRHCIIVIIFVAARGSIWALQRPFDKGVLQSYKICFSPRDGGALAVYKSLFRIVIAEIPGMFLGGKIQML